MARRLWGRPCVRFARAHWRRWWGLRTTGELCVACPGAALPPSSVAARVQPLPRARCILLERRAPCGAFGTRAATSAGTPTIRTFHLADVVLRGPITGNPHITFTTTHFPSLALSRLGLQPNNLFHYYVAGRVCAESRGLNYSSRPLGGNSQCRFDRWPFCDGFVIELICHELARYGRCSFTRCAAPWRTIRNSGNDCGRVLGLHIFEFVNSEIEPIVILVYRRLVFFLTFQVLRTALTVTVLKITMREIADQSHKHDANF